MHMRVRVHDHRSPLLLSPIKRKTQDAVQWRAGQRIIVATTDFYGVKYSDSFTYPRQTEEVTVQAVTNGGNYDMLFSLFYVFVISNLFFSVYFCVCKVNFLLGSLYHIILQMFFFGT